MRMLHDSTFSLYGLITRASIDNIFTERTPLLALWSKQIETAVIDRKLDTDVYAGFQDLNRTKPVYPRYQQMTCVAHSVTVFGTTDNLTFDPVGLNCVALSADDRLVHEWFLVVNHPRYHRALVAQEIAPHVYRGVLTSDPEQVARFDAALAQNLNRSQA